MSEETVHVARFEHNQEVYLVCDSSKWLVTHIIVDCNGQIQYRISNGYKQREVFEIELTEDGNLVKKIKGMLCRDTT